MADDDAARAAIQIECEAVQRDGRKSVDQMHRQLRELRLLVRQIETELRQLAPRRSEREEQLRLVEANPGPLSPTALREANAALADVSNKQFLMQVQVDSLRQREQTLLLQSSQMERVLDLLGRIRASLPALASAAPTPSTSATEEPDSPRETALRVVAAREAQSRHLSQEVLDGPVRALSNHILQAEVGLRLLGRDKERAAAEVKELKDSLAATLGDLRRFAADLCPPALAEVGLRATIRRYLEEMVKRSGLPLRFTAGGQDLRLGAELELQVFRTLQEALLYTTKRSRPSEVEITLIMESGRLELSLISSGAPSDGTLPQVDELQNLETYVQACNGDYRVEQPDETALHITITVPLPTAG